MSNSTQSGSSRLRNVRGVPRAVKAALIADAARQESSVNDVALCILAEHFGTDCPEQGNQPRSDPTLGDQLQLRLPDKHGLWNCFWAAARSLGTTESSAIVKVLSDYYEIPYEPVRRGRKPNALR